MKIFAAAVSFLFMFSCRTVPDDAPEEFFSAKEAIDKMDEVDAEDTLPNTAEYAKNAFDESLDMLKSARNNESEYTVGEAIEMANDARLHAEAVTGVHDTVKNWDMNRINFKDALAFLDNREEGVVGVAVIETESPLAKLAGTEIASTLAYFDTDEYTDPKIASSEMDSLVEILTRASNYNVTLIGSTDPRGSDSYNKKLAMARAYQVAERLYDAGIAKDRVAMKTLDAKERFTGLDSSLARMQLDRRVVARLRLD